MDSARRRRVGRCSSLESLESLAGELSLLPVSLLHMARRGGDGAGYQGVRRVRWLCNDGADFIVDRKVGGPNSSTARVSRAENRHVVRPSYGQKVEGNARSLCLREMPRAQAMESGRRHGVVMRRCGVGEGCVLTLANALAGRQLGRDAKTATPQPHDES